MRRAFAASGVTASSNGHGKSPSSPLLAAVSCSFGYGGIPMVADLDLSVEAGEVVALLGPNGAGKSTTLLGLAGELKPMSGAVHWLGNPTRASLYRRARGGLAFIPEERSVISKLTAGENIRLGGGSMDLALELFPELEPLLCMSAGLLSGGEQQILTMARALSRRPRMLLADELSLGLAPLVTERLFKALEDAARSGLGVLLVEQQVRSALQVSSRAYVLARGRVVMSGASRDLLGRLDEVEDRYFED